MNNLDEIILTNGNEYKKFPKTPRPDIRYDGIFPTKEQIKEKIIFKFKKLREK